MARLSRTDMEAALAFAAEVSTAAPGADRADLWLLERISRLIGLETAGYNQLATSSSRFLSDAALQAVRPGSVVDGRLSSRENEVMDLVAAGASNAEIAERLSISPGTVRKHLEHIYSKLEVGSRTAALSRTGRSAMSAPHEA